MVENYFLKNSEEKGDRSYKLQLRRHDQATLRAIIDGSEMPRDILSVSERTTSSSGVSWATPTRRSYIAASDGSWSLM